MSAPNLEVHRIVALLYAHQKVSTLSDACTCGAGDINTRQESGVAIARHWEHLARVIVAPPVVITQR